MKIIMTSKQPKATIKKVVDFLNKNRRFIANHQMQMAYDLATAKIRTADSVKEIRRQLNWLVNDYKFPSKIREIIK